MKCEATTTVDGRFRRCERKAGDPRCEAGQHWTTIGGRDHYWRVPFPPVPDFCNSLVCSATPGHHPHCRECSHAYYRGEATVPTRRGQVVYRWEFNPRHGPEFSNAHGRAVTCPSRALWRAFDAWRLAKFGEGKA